MNGDERRIRELVPEAASKEERLVRSAKPPSEAHFWASAPDQGFAPPPTEALASGLQVLGAPVYALGGAQSITLLSGPSAASQIAGSGQIETLSPHKPAPLHLPEKPQLAASNVGFAASVKHNVVTRLEPQSPGVVYLGDSGTGSERIGKGAAASGDGQYPSWEPPGPAAGALFLSYPTFPDCNDLQAWATLLQKEASGRYGPPGAVPDARHKFCALCPPSPGKAALAEQWCEGIPGGYFAPPKLDSTDTDTGVSLTIPGSTIPGQNCPGGADFELPCDRDGIYVMGLDGAYGWVPGKCKSKLPYHVPPAQTPPLCDGAKTPGFQIYAAIRGLVGGYFDAVLRSTGLFLDPPYILLDWYVTHAAEARPQYDPVRSQFTLVARTYVTVAIVLRLNWSDPYKNKWVLLPLPGGITIVGQCAHYAVPFDQVQGPQFASFLPFSNHAGDARPHHQPGFHART